MDNFDYKKYLAEGRLLKENIYTATDDDGFGSFIDDFASTIGYDNNTVHPSAVEMAGEPIEITPQHFIAHSPAWREFGYEKYWNRIPDGQPFKITGDTVGLTDYPFLKNYTFIKMGNVIKGKIDMAEGRIHLNEENVPDNITSVVDDMTITMGEDAFIAAVFKALPLEDAKRVLRIITNDNPIENVLGPVTYDWLNEDFASKAQQKFLYANNPKAAKKLASKMSKKDYKNLPDRVNEGVEDNLWASYVKSLINDIRLNGIGEYGGASEGDIIEDFENYIADKF